MLTVEVSYHFIDQQTSSWISSIVCWQGLKVVANSTLDSTIYFAFVDFLALVECLFIQATAQFAEVDSTARQIVALSTDSKLDYSVAGPSLARADRRGPNQDSNVLVGSLPTQDEPFRREPLGQLVF